MGTRDLWAEQEREQTDYRQAQLALAGQGHAPNPSTSYWNIEGREDVRVRYGTVSNVMKLRETELGGSTFLWFKEGLGIVKAEFIRDLNYVTSHTELVDFTPAAGTSHPASPEQ